MQAGAWRPHLKAPGVERVHKEVGPQAPFAGHLRRRRLVVHAAQT